MDIETRPINPNIGVEIRGVDLSQPLPDDVLEQVRTAWLDNVIAVFPEQDIGDDEHIAFSRQLGELEVLNMSALELDGRPEIYEATHLDKNNDLMVDDNPVLAINRGNQKWHSDSSF